MNDLQIENMILTTARLVKVKICQIKCNNFVIIEDFLIKMRKRWEKITRKNIHENKKYF